MHGYDLVVPVVGDVSGAHAMPAIAAEMTTRGTPLSAFYISNVEYYLFGDGTFPKFVENLSHLPHTRQSLIIRSVFAGGFGSLPYSLPGYGSASVVQPVDDVLNGRFGSYRDLIR